MCAEISVILENAGKSVAGRTESSGSSPSVQTVAAVSLGMRSTHSTWLPRTMGYNNKKTRFWSVRRRVRSRF